MSSEESMKLNGFSEQTHSEGDLDVSCLRLTACKPVDSERMEHTGDGASWKQSPLEDTAIMTWKEPLESEGNYGEEPAYIEQNWELRDSIKAEVPIPPPKPAKGLPPWWHDRPNLKIRYTRQYLLDLQNHPLSMSFPKCLMSFLDARQLPLKELPPKIASDRRNIDHILFYTSLPYTRMRNPAAMGSRKAFKLNF